MPVCGDDSNRAVSTISPRPNASESSSRATPLSPNHAGQRGAALDHGLALLCDGAGTSRLCGVIVHVVLMVDRPRARVEHGERAGLGRRGEDESAVGRDRGGSIDRSERDARLVEQVDESRGARAVDAGEVHLRLGHLVGSLDVAVGLLGGPAACLSARGVFGRRAAG